MEQRPEQPGGISVGSPADPVASLAELLADMAHDVIADDEIVEVTAGELRVLLARVATAETQRAEIADQLAARIMKATLP